MPYVRLRVNSGAEEGITELGAQVRMLTGSHGQGVFYDQLDPRAELGCHPYHVTLVAGLHMYRDDEVALAMRAAVEALPTALSATPTGGVTGFVVGRRGGSVKLMVQLQGVAELKRELHRLLPRGRLYRDPHHITLGNFFGTARERENFRAALLSAQFAGAVGLQFQGLELEYENDAVRPNPEPVALLGLVNPVPGVADGPEVAAARRLSHAHQTCIGLPAVAARAARRPDGFGFLEPVDHAALQMLLRPVHDAIEWAFAEAAEFTARELQAHSNPYPGQNLANVSPGSGTWKSKLWNLHASAVDNTAFRRVLEGGRPGILHPVSVTGGGERGWHPTSSPLMCYLSGRGLWITLHLADIGDGLEPGDGDHWHFSIAKIDRCRLR